MIEAMFSGRAFLHGISVAAVGGALAAVLAEVLVRGLLGGRKEIGQ